MLVASTASAVHYYGVIRNLNVPAGNADQGGYVILTTNTLARSSCSEFINHEFWYGPTPYFSQWVEVGFKDGASQAGCKTRTVFWGENNGSGYHFHGKSNSWSLGSRYSATIVQSINCEWYVYLGGSLMGISQNNCAGTGRSIEAGIESTSQTSGNTADGFTDTWQRYTSGGSWVSGWNATLYRNSPPDITYPDILTQTNTEEWQ
jgi:hypothetical protein